MASLRNQATDDRSAGGAEAYPYDPTLRLESQRGLDRLRCFPDRALAAEFFALFQAAERNTEAALLAQREQARRDAADLNGLCALAARTLAGEFGAEPKELAKRLLLDQAGQCTKNARVLREFKRALVQLKRIPG
jgi:hypothetical protein